MHTEQTTSFSVRVGRGDLGLDRRRRRVDAVAHRPLDRLQLRRAVRAAPRCCRSCCRTVGRRQPPRRLVAASTAARTPSPPRRSSQDLTGDARRAERRLVSLRLLRLWRCAGAAGAGRRPPTQRDPRAAPLRLDRGAGGDVEPARRRCWSKREHRRHGDEPASRCEVRDDDGRGGPGRRSPARSSRGARHLRRLLRRPRAHRGDVRPDGWVRSGDLVILDDDGYLTVVGRKKEIIIRGGINIAPREIEDLLLEHAAVAAVSVVGVPDARLGEIVSACLVLEEGATITLDELAGHLTRRSVAVQDPAAVGDRRVAPHHADREGPQVRVVREHHAAASAGTDAT